MTEATQQGAEVSVEDRIAEILEPSEISDKTPEEEATHEGAEPVDETDEDQPETDDSEGPESEEDDGETDETDAVEEIELDASALAEYFGVDEDAFDVTEDGQLAFKTKIDGKEGKANLAELLKSYQLEGHVNQKSMQLAEERKAFESETQAAKQELQQTLQQAQNLINLQKQNLMAEYNAIDWNELKAQDPGLYAATRQEMSERYSQIEQAAQYTNQQTSQMTAEQRHQMLIKEGQALEAAIPEWANDEVREKEQGAVAQFLTSHGYKPEEVAQVADHRAVLVARKAMLYDRMMSDQATKADVAKKKVIKKPKVIKPGAAKQKGRAAAEAQKAKLKLVKQSGGSVDAVASLLIDRM